MSARINQQLRDTYNPDGTPGTITAGEQGEAGRGPTQEELVAAVAEYFATQDTAIDTTVPTDAAAGVAQGQLSGALAEVLATRVYTYASATGQRRGFLLPELPVTLQSGDIALLVATLWRAVQELSAREDFS